jgi:phosphoribosyl 1,2-cyclic phosphodiesterase
MRPEGGPSFAGPPPDTGLRLRFWGTRGSIPSPGASTVRYGGNTPCLEVLSGERRYIMDSGTGIRALGLEILATGASARATLFLTHFHWDHIQGFPFFRPLFDPAADLRIVGPRQEDSDVRSLLEGQMGSIHFPIPLGAIKARTAFEHLNEGDWSDGTATVAAMRVRHPSFTVGYRIEIGGIRMGYVPDNELDGAEHSLGAGWRDRFRTFVEGIDLLVHDAMYTDKEFGSRVGWGHSTFDQCLDLASEAGVKRLLFFHHDPERTDGDLDEWVDRAREQAYRRGGPEVDAAREGEVLEL